MEMPNNLSKIRVIIVLAGVDILLLLCTAFFVGEDSRRWPLLLVVGPALILINVIGFRRMNRVSKGPAMTMSAIYSCGLLGGIYWTLEDFRWWKCIGLVVLLFLLIASLSRRRSVIDSSL